MFRSALTIFLIAILLGACDRTTPDEHVHRAQEYFDTANYSSAVIELKNALQKQPDLSTARFLLGRSYFALADFPSATREFEKTIDLGLDSPRLRIEYLSAKNRLGRHQEVIGDLADAGSLEPELAAVLADAYLAGGDVDKAQVLYLQGTGIAAGNLGLGTIAWMQGDVVRATALLNKATELSPADRDAWLRLAEFELSQGDTTAALNSFARAKTLPGGSISGRLGLARVYLSSGELEAAAAEVAEVLQSASGLTIAHYLDALIKYQLKDVDGAEVALREVQRAAPDHAPSLYLMGAVKLQQNQLNQAEDNLQRFLGRDRDNESAAKLLAAIKIKQGNQQSAIDVLLPFSDETQDPQLLAMLGTASLRAGDSAQAIPLLERAVALAPNAAVFRNQLALSLLSAGDETRAVSELQSAIAVDERQFQSEYLMALLHMKEQDYQAALEASDAIIGKNPVSPLGYQLRGIALLGENQEPAARSAFESALQADPTFLPAASNLARLDLRAGDQRAARSRFEAVLAVTPENIEAMLALADLQAVTGQPEAAEALLTRILDLQSENIRARLGLLRLMLVSNQLTAAAEHSEILLDLAPDSIDVALAAAELSLRSGDLAQARALSDRLQSRIGSRKVNAALLTSLGTLQSKVGQFTLARRNLESALEQSPDAAANRSALLELCRLDLRQRDTQSARQRLDRLPEADQGGDDVALLRADLLLAEKNEQMAAAAYTELADKGVREAVARIVLLRLQEGDLNIALARLEDWLRQNPNDVGMGLLRGDALMRKSDKSGAIQQYEALLSADNPVVYNNLAWLYLERNDSRALGTAQRAVELAPANPDIMDTLGWVLLKTGEPDRAIEILDRSLQINPGNASVRYHLAVAHIEAGNRSAGIDALTRALELGAFPEAEDARALLAQVQ